MYQRLKHSVVSTAQAAADSVKQAGRSVGGATQSAYQATAHSLHQAVQHVKGSTNTATQRLQQPFKSQDSTEQ